MMQNFQKDTYLNTGYRNLCDSTQLVTLDSKSVSAAARTENFQHTNVYYKLLEPLHIDSATDVFLEYFHIQNVDINSLNIEKTPYYCIDIPELDIKTYSNNDFFTNKFVIPNDVFGDTDDHPNDSTADVQTYHLRLKSNFISTIQAKTIHGFHVSITGIVGESDLEYVLTASSLLLNYEAWNYSGSGNWLNQVDTDLNPAVNEESSDITYNAVVPKSFVFIGTDNKRLNCGNVDLQQDWSIEVWVKFDGLGVGVEGMIGHGITSNNNGLHLQVFNSGAQTRFGFHSDDVDVTFGSALVNDTWYHLVYTYSNTNPYTKQVYLNGALEGSGTGSAYARATDKLSIGSTYSPETNGNEMDGEIAAVRVYTKVLSASEITTNYNVGYQASASGGVSGITTIATDSNGRKHFTGQFTNYTIDNRAISADAGDASFNTCGAVKLSLLFRKRDKYNDQVLKLQNDTYKDTIYKNSQYFNDKQLYQVLVLDSIASVSTANLATLDPANKNSREAYFHFNNIKFNLLESLIIDTKCEIYLEYISFNNQMLIYYPSTFDGTPSSSNSRSHLEASSSFYLDIPELKLKTFTNNEYAANKYILPNEIFGKSDDNANDDDADVKTYNIKLKRNFIGIIEPTTLKQLTVSITGDDYRESTPNLAHYYLGNSSAATATTSSSVQIALLFKKIQ
jgi:hypothetical protein